MPKQLNDPHGSMQPSSIAQPRIQCDCTIEPQLPELHVETRYGTTNVMHVSSLET